MNPDISSPHPVPSLVKRTFELKLLIAEMLILSLYGWLRLEQAIVGWDWLIQVGIRPGPGYLVISGLLWGLAGAGAGVALLVRWRWSPLIACLGALFCALLYWFERLVFTRSNDNLSNIPFAVVLTLLGLGLVFGVLALPRQRKYFSNYEQKPPRD